MNTLILIAILAAGIGLAVFLSSRCPNCKRPFVLRFTDEFRETEKLGVKIKQREVLCRRCGHRFWRDHKEASPGPGD